MAWADQVTAIASACVDAFGQPCTYTAGITATSIDVVLRRASEPILVGGQIQILEDHFAAEIPVAALTGTPAIGDTLTDADSVVYRVDVPPESDGAMYRLIVRRLG